MCYQSKPSRMARTPVSPLDLCSKLLSFNNVNKIAAISNMSTQGEGRQRRGKGEREREWESRKRARETRKSTATAGEKRQRENKKCLQANVSLYRRKRSDHTQGAGDEEQNWGRTTRGRTPQELEALFKYMRHLLGFIAR